MYILIIGGVLELYTYLNNNNLHVHVSMYVCIAVPILERNVCMKPKSVTKIS